MKETAKRKNEGPTRDKEERKERAVGKEWAVSDAPKCEA